MKRQLIALLFFSIASLASIANEPERYPKSLVHSNVTKYLELLVSNQEPTLDDYHRWHSANSEIELGLELIECERKWGDTFSFHQNFENLGAECKAFLASRNKHPDEAKSLYLHSIRSYLNSRGASYFVGAIKDNSDGWYLVDAKIGINHLKLMHIPDVRFVGIGTLFITHIDGVSEKEFIGKSRD